jgi:tetratricopeptide (TPR) repeat protein
VRASVLTVFVAAFAAPAVVSAAGEFIEDIQVSRSGDTATVRFELACPMRFQSDLATEAGALIEIRIAPLESCRADELASEIYRPPGGRLAHVVEVEYDALGLGENLLVVRFDRPVQYRVAQRGDLRRLDLVVSTGDAAASTARANAAPPIVETEARPPATVPTDRAPLTLRVREPETPADYVVNLQSTRAPPDSALLESIAVPSERRLYVSSTDIDRAEWHRVRLGFFATEAEARAALEPLLATFPRAWVGRAEPEEVQSAAGFVVIARGSVDDATAAESRAATESAAAPVGADEAQALLAEGRAALLASDFDKAVRTYSSLLASPAPHGAEAREYLGVARERMGQPMFARAEYERYLADYPDGEGAARVRQRLSGLVTAAEPPREPPRGSPRPREAERGTWDLSTGLSQYYRRAVDRLDENQAEVVTLSALFTDLDFSVRHSGERLDLRGRVTINQQHDLIGEDSGGPGDRNRVSYAYFDVDSAARDWSLRLGRQTLRSGGVLGRFDGAHAAYEWSDGRRVHVTTGHPVESTRDSIDSEREFFGAAVDFDKLICAWDLSTFVTFGTIEGIEDRRATGLEVRYADASRSLTTLVDYDVGYSVLNTALALGTWRLPNRTTLSALVDVRTSPVLTTRNALIGQPVSTIEELMLVWTEDEIRQLARDRSADSRTATLGVAAPIGERFQLNGDVTFTEIGSTVESAGVPAIPSTGTQLYYSGSFVGTGLIGGGDVMIFNVRYGESPSFTLSQLTWDARFPIGRSLRINPRLRLAVWQDLANGRRRETLMPAFRLLLNARNRYRLELEVGNDQFTRTDGASDQKASGRFFNLGYRADF